MTLILQIAAGVVLGFAVLAILAAICGYVGAALDLWPDRFWSDR